jgi:iron complex transport system substrate-binding protein
VGALLDPDVERILSLRPDLVAVYSSQTDLRRQLDRAHIPQYVYTHAGLADVTTTMRDLGARVGHAAEATRLADAIEARIATLRKQAEGKPRPRTLIVIGREAGALRGIYASGGIGFIHDIVSAAGGDNIFADVKREGLPATTELILARKPEVILELRGSALGPDGARREAETWNRLPSLPAAKNHRVYVLTDDRVVVPGPRVAEAIELIARNLR